MEGFRELIELHLAEQEEREARKRQERLRAQIAELDERLADARAKLAAAQERLNAIVAERRRLEAEVEDLDGKRKKYRNQLMEAKTNEVYRTFLSEIETAGRLISEKETLILERMERIDAAEQAVAEAKAELDEAEGLNRGEARLLQGEVDTLDDLRAAARQSAEERRKRVPGRLLPTYDRIFKARDSKALSLCVDLTCSECHVAIRPQVWVEILRQEKIHQCGGCGRILFREESAQPVVAGGDESGTTSEEA